MLLHPKVIQVRGGVLIVHVDSTETVIHQKLPKLENLPETSVGVATQQLEEQNESGARRPSSSERRSSLTVFANQASCFPAQRGVLALATPAGAPPDDSERKPGTHNSLVNVFWA